MRKRIVIAITAALPLLAIAGYAAASGAVRAGRGTSCDGPVPQRRRGEGGRLRARVRERRGEQDHHRLHRAPHGRRDGLPLLQQGADRRSGRDVSKPEGLVYAPASNGELKLVAVEYVVPGAGSNPPGVSEPPTVLGQEMVILVPAVGWYTRHSWVWSTNPAGILAHWSPEVTCT